MLFASIGVRLDRQDRSFSAIEVFDSTAQGRRADQIHPNAIQHSVGDEF